MKKLSTLLFLAALALVGCKDNDPVQTVDWYKANAPERAAMLAKCKTNPGELAASPNWGRASSRVTSRHFDHGRSSRVFISRSNRPYGLTCSQISGVRAA